MSSRFRPFRRRLSFLELEGARRGGTLPHELFLKIYGPRKRIVRFGGVVGSRPDLRRGYFVKSTAQAGSLVQHNIRVGSPFSPHGVTLCLHWKRRRRPR